MTTVSDIAAQAIAFLERGWTQVDPACDADGKAVEVWSPRAVAWSLLGAVCAVPSDAKIDKIKLQVIGRMRVFMDRNATFADVNQSKEAAVAMLGRCLAPSGPIRPA